MIKSKYNKNYYILNKKKINDKNNLWYKNCDQEKRRKHYQNWYIKNREKVLEKQKNKSKSKIKDLSLKSRYGISLNDFNRLLKKQNSKCKICRLKEVAKATQNKIKSLSIDHNHTTGKIRGLLCQNCNAGIGLFKENINLLKKVINYLEKTK